MGIYKRRDSKFWWMWLERPGQKAVIRSTKIPHHDTSPEIRRELEHQAEIVYKAAMVELARARFDLPALITQTIRFDAYAEWFDLHVISKRRGAERDRLSLSHLCAFFGTDDLSTVSRARAQEYMTARLSARIGKPPKPGRPDTRRAVKPATVNREIDLLKEMLREAVPAHLKASPLVGMKRLRTVKIQKRVITPAEERRLIKALAPADAALYIVAVDTLIRLGNVLNLRRDENHDTHLALTDSKTGPYEVPLSDRARQALAELADTGPYYFAHRRGAKTDRDRRSAIRRMLERACKAADVPYGRAVAGTTFHQATRATGATRMIQRGVDIRTVQAVGNWADFRSMQDYLQTDRELMREAVNRIGPPVVKSLPPLTPDSQPEAKRRKSSKKTSAA